MGADGPGSGVEERLRALNEAASGAGPKHPADRLYGRARGHALRPRQQRLLEMTLPRLRFPLGGAAAPDAVFVPRLGRLALEIGFGGGEHSAAQVAAEPEMALIACEVFENGLCSLLSRLVPEPLDEATAPLPPNLRLWDEDARTLLRALPAGCLDRVFLLFPDPWPKARHVKRRFVHPAQIPLVARVVRPGGTWRIASDDPTYQAWTRDVMAEQSWFHPATPERQRPAGWPPTRYEAKALRAGRSPLYWSFVRTDSPVGSDLMEPRWTALQP